ncbi:serine hydrolase domain-containing protein [Altibacter sp. HG106]|uniref:serine hydrolase domain-containing protein n=1 Tax=Altibacter sp. HG106 TaxID=3023937 RepID=UPI0023501C0B|nr:serine hydrolase [Altibacter sp. HG106]MDC7995058.1 serine hydrolase [Altibacter sp. HG106]
MKRFLLFFFAIILFLLGLMHVTDTTYILKGIRVVYFTGHTTAFIDDFKYFDNDTIPPSNTPQPWPKHEAYNLAAPTPALQRINEELGTVAFLIFKNDSLWYERYADGYGPTSHTNSFSMAKSVITALLGKAIDDGYIKSLDQPVGDFFPKFTDTNLTVGDLSSMASGLNWDESYHSPFSMTARSYYDDDLAPLILDLEVVDTPGESFTYLSGNTQLLAIVIEKAVGQKIPDYFNTSFWQPMGAEQSALWQWDDEEHQLVKAYCCWGSNARDFARFGKLFSNNGRWNNTQLLDSTFVQKAIRPRFEASPEYGYGFWLSDHLDKQIFVMRGILGQYVISIPEDDLVIVRLGHERGAHSGKPFTDDFYVYVSEAYAMLESL